SWANVRLSDGRQVGIGIDIHKFREAEKCLKESEEKFRNLADNISQLAWITDEKGKIKWYNKRWYEFTGMKMETNNETNFLDLIHPSHRSQVRAYFTECIRNETTWEDSFPIKGKDNRYHWFLSRALPIRDENSKIKSWFGTNTNITELKHLQDKLISANEKAENAIILQKTFIQNISHEVRTPMNSILGFTDLLQKSHFDPEEKEYLDSISYNGKQLLNLINDIIDFSRLDAKELKLTQDEVELNKVFLELENQFEALVHHFKKDKIELKINIKENDIIIYADHHRLQQVISNLLSNAVKYTEKGFIETGYEIRKDKNEILFFVKDSGIGIEKKYKSLIFNRFHQTDRKQLHGTGLGLAICKHLVNLFGGEIWFESETDKGSSFYFTYPLKEVSLKNKKSASNGDEINTAKPDLKGKTILIAEDDDYSFQLLEAILAPTNANILHASNGKEAVELFRKNKTDLVFLDIRLPELDGYEILDIIKEENENIPVIAQTAYAMPEDKTKSHNRGFDFHTTKPISMKDMYVILNTFLPLNDRKLA
ncbi:MAG: ATP-binding protein, partial [Bacteroidota bacterium]